MRALSSSWLAERRSASFLPLVVLILKRPRGPIGILFLKPEKIPFLVPLAFDAGDDAGDNAGGDAGGDAGDNAGGDAGDNAGGDAGGDAALFVRDLTACPCLSVLAMCLARRRFRPARALSLSARASSSGVL